MDCVIVVNLDRINECFGAVVLKNCLKMRTIPNRSIHTIDEDVMEKLQVFEEVIIAGNYLDDSVERVAAVAKKVILFLDEREFTTCESPNLTIMSSHDGFATFAVKRAEEKGFKFKKSLLFKLRKLGRIVDTLERGEITKEVIQFMYEFAIGSDPMIDKVKKIIIDGVPVHDILSRGKLQMERNYVNHDMNLLDAETVEFEGNKIMVTYADLAQMETCLTLSKQTGIAIVISYNVYKGREREDPDMSTLLLCMATSESELDAGRFLHKHFGGYGSKYYAKATVTKKLTIANLFNSNN